MDSESTIGGQDNAAQPPDRVELQTYSDSISAELVKARLEANGIECWLTADDCGGMLTAMDAVRGVRLFVRQADRDAASVLLTSEPVNLGQPDEPVLGTPASSDSPVKTRLSLFQLTAGVVIGVLLCLLYQWTAKSGTKKYRYDMDGDGRIDEIAVYRNGYAVEQSFDRNFDGAFDAWYFWDSNGMRASSKSDENFDGVPDTMWNYTNGVLASARCDTDFNGTPDLTSTYEHELLKQGDWQPNGAKMITLRQIFHHGVLKEELRDTNADGQFDLTIRYDPFNNPIGTNVFKLLSPTTQ